MGNRSPIERMVDAACGYTTPATLPILRCPKCGKEKYAMLEKREPQHTAVIELTCPDCWQPGTYESPIYFDSDGKQILS